MRRLAPRWVVRPTFRANRVGKSTRVERANGPVLGLTGSYGGLNLGDEAILTATVDQLRRLVPRVRITVFSRDTEHTREHYDVERVVAARSATREELAAEVGALDLLVVGGGGILYDREARSYLFVARIAQELGVPTATYAIGAGPLERAAEREAVASVLNRMECITVRDASSHRLLQEIGVDNEIVVTGDPALLLDPLPFTDEMLEHERMPNDRASVGISVREPGGAVEDIDQDAYTSLLANAADFIVQRFDANVLFVPMERQDIRWSHRVIAEMGEPQRARILQGDYDPRQIIGLMSRLDFAVGMRLHFLLFAARAGKPIVALPYASKVTSFLEALGVPTPDRMYRYHAGSMCAFIDSLWDARSKLSAHIRRTLPALQRRAGETPRIVAELLGGHEPVGARRAVAAGGE